MSKLGIKKQTQSDIIVVSSKKKFKYSIYRYERVSINKCLDKILMELSKNFKTHERK